IRPAAARGGVCWLVFVDLVSLPMLFQHVAIAGLAHIDAPRRLSTDEINARLRPTLDRLGIKADVLKDIAGIHARHLWDEGVQASDAATLAGVKALADAGIDPDKVGLRSEEHTSELQSRENLV